MGGQISVWLIGYGSIMCICYLFKYADLLSDGNVK